MLRFQSSATRTGKGPGLPWADGADSGLNWSDSDKDSHVCHARHSHLWSLNVYKMGPLLPAHIICFDDWRPQSWRKTITQLVVKGMLILCTAASLDTFSTTFQATGGLLISSETLAQPVVIGRACLISEDCSARTSRSLAFCLGVGVNRKDFES